MDSQLQPQGPLNTRERAIKTVPEPIASKPTEQEFLLTDLYGTRLPNPDFLKRHFFQEGRLTETQALFILEKATEVLQQEPNVVEVRSPVTICGDIHGQYYDLMKIFEVGGPPKDTTYLWLGDYVDRGSFALQLNHLLQCLLYLYTLKLWYPKTFTFLRGNHECRHLTEYFTFKKECLHKYSPEVYEACVQSFCALPIAAIINRFQEPGSSGLLCDLLWSDPVQNFGYEQDSSGTGTTFLPNPMRGCSYLYTYEAACQFLERNNLLGIIRGHEAQDAGYTMHRKTPTKKFPSVITIFSAPNYCDCYHNRGAVLKYANKNITIRQYNSSAHPYWLPNFMDAFTWSLPFVGSKITEMLLAILSICSEEELHLEEEDDMEGPVNPEEVAERREAIKKKILAVGRMQRMFQLLREESETASELVDESTPGYSTGSRRTNLTAQAARPRIASFADARRSDIANERLPAFPAEGQPAPSTMFPTPSMRLPGRSPDEPPVNMEYLIKRSLEEDETGGQDIDTVEMLADRLAGNRRRITPTSRMTLKRHETSQL
ncbi:Metallo-dependent phosphatase-like protein [Flagelloscypha sp. PMI_526]|nr:Metallo-dependent phosphatase-like protein [Flagelloscypha sp. PMI_526]